MKHRSTINTRFKVVTLDGPNTSILTSVYKLNKYQKQSILTSVWKCCNVSMDNGFIWKVACRRHERDECYSCITFISH